MLAVAEAQECGELVSMGEELRTGGRNVGRTPRETLQYISAVQDLEDQRRHLAAVRAFNRFMEQYGSDVEGFGTVAADASAPTVREIELAEAAGFKQRAEQLERGRKIGEQRRSRAQEQKMREIAQTEIAVERADPRPINALLARAQRRDDGRRG